jgi:protein SCO1/2
MSRRVLRACMLVVSFLALGGAARAEVGIDEKLGETIPLDVMVRDEHGREIPLRDLVDRPILLTLVYYECPNICNVLLSGVADVIGKTNLAPGKDFRVLSLSFNPDETPELALAKKTNYLKILKKPIDDDAWRFLTAASETIDAITKATGFKYEKVDDMYNHAAAVILLTPEGKVSRYLYGVTFLPFAVQMAVYEAAQGKTGPAISRVLLYCFSYDPASRTYAFNILKVTGTLTLLVLALFAGTLLIMSRARRMTPTDKDAGEPRA